MVSLKEKVSSKTANNNGSSPIDGSDRKKIFG